MTRVHPSRLSVVRCDFLLPQSFEVRFHTRGWCFKFPEAEHTYASRCRHFDVSTTGQLQEVKEGLALAFLEKMVSRDELWITATVSTCP